MADLTKDASVTFKSSAGNNPWDGKSAVVKKVFSDGESYVIRFEDGNETWATTDELTLRA